MLLEVYNCVEIILHWIFNNISPCVKTKVKDNIHTQYTKRFLNQFSIFNHNTHFVFTLFQTPFTGNKKSNKGNQCFMHRRFKLFTLLSKSVLNIFLRVLNIFLSVLNIFFNLNIEKMSLFKIKQMEELFFSVVHFINRTPSFERLVISFVTFIIITFIVTVLKSTQYLLRGFYNMNKYIGANKHFYTNNYNIIQEKYQASILEKNIGTYNSVVQYKNLYYCTIISAYFLYYTYIT